MKYNLGFVYSGILDIYRYPGQDKYFGNWENYKQRYISNLKNITRAKILNEIHINTFMYYTKQDKKNYVKGLKIFTEE